MTKKYDVLIVGCGPSGAVLANSLNALGYKVAIFDRDKAIFHAPRAMMLDVESCRIIHRLGLFERLMERDAVPFQSHKFVDKFHNVLMAVDVPENESDFGYPESGVMFHQPAFESMLRDEFKRNVGVDSFLGYEVLKVDGDGNEAVLTARNLDSGQESQFAGHYLVGADGGASMCRKHVGGSRVDLNYSRDWIVMDLIIHDKAWWNNFREGSEFTCEPNGAVVVVKGMHGHIRVDFEQLSKEHADAFSEEDAYRLIAEYLDVDSGAVEIIRCQPYKFYAGMPDRWRKGRVLLAGDAAHQTSPFAGQGLNMGIRDSANLAFKFDMLFKGYVNDSILDTYFEERWKNCAHMIGGATKRGKMLSTSSQWEILFRNLSFMLGRMSKRLAYRMTKNMSDITPYQDGLIGKAHGLSGARFFPSQEYQSDGTGIRFDDLMGDQFTLLSRKSVAGEAVEWLCAELGGKSMVIGEDISDNDGKLAAYFKTHNIDVLLIRPDFYIFDAGLDANGLCAALRRKLTNYGLTSFNRVGCESLA